MAIAADENASRIVREAYLQILGREADPAGLAAYTEALVSGALDVRALAREFYSSDEYRSRAFPDNRLPPTEPEDGGCETLSKTAAETLVEEANSICPGRPLTVVEAQRIADDLCHERTSLARAIEEVAGLKLSPLDAGAANLEAAHVVFDAYETVLGRRPDLEGFRAFTAAIASGDLSPSQLADALRGSSEFASRGLASSTRSEGQLKLDASYYIDREVFIRHRDDSLARYMERARDHRVSKHFRLVFAVIANDCEVEDLKSTLASVDRLVSSSDGCKTAVIGAPEWLRRAEKDSGRRCRAEDIFEFESELVARLNTDDILVVLRAGDVVQAEMLEVLRREAGKGFKLISFDGFCGEGHKVFPIFHPGANYTHLLNVDYLFSRFACRAEVLASTSKGKRPLIDQVREWLSAAPQLRCRAWQHVELPLLELGVSHSHILNVRKELREAKQPVAWGGRDVNSSGKVSIVICTKDKGFLLEQVVTNCLEMQGERIAEIIIVSNQTENLNAKDVLRRLSSSPKIKILYYNKPFNFSAQSNLGGGMSSGDYVLFLNDDIVAVDPDWLSRLLSHFKDPSVGIVGPLLLYPDERIQHAGMFLGFRKGAGHTLRGAILPDEDYLFYASAPREVSCVTGAVLMISQKCLEDLNGWDELLATYLQDVDLCLRAVSSGYKIIFEPRSVLLHMESVSVSSYLQNRPVSDNRAREHEYFMRRWSGEICSDPFFNSNFANSDETLRLLRTDPSC